MVGPRDSTNVDKKCQMHLEPGDRLITVDSEAREAIVHPVLAAGAAEEARDERSWRLYSDCGRGFTGTAANAFGFICQGAP